MEKELQEIKGWLNSIAVWTGQISRSIEELTISLNKNSNSSDKLARAWNFIWGVWLLATIVWIKFWILTFYYK